MMLTGRLVHRGRSRSEEKAVWGFVWEVGVGCD